MAITPSSMVDSLNKFCLVWDKAGLTLASNRSNIYKLGNNLSRVSWDSNQQIVLKDNEFSSLSEYLTLLSSSQYTLVLTDGSLIQISYTFRRNEIVGHRLCWYPSPIDISGVTEVDEIIDKTQLILKEGGDALEEHITSPDEPKYPVNVKGLYNKSPLRFDFSIMSDGEKDAHPDVHLHISVENCRIPVKTPLCIRMFMKFILENFYSELPTTGALINNIPSWENNDMLTPYHKKKFHFNYIR